MARSSTQLRAAALLGRLFEWLLLLLLCAAPWAFGAVHPLATHLLLVGLSILLALLAVQVLLRGELGWRPGGADFALAGIVLVGLLQSAALPRGLLDALSPATGALYDELLPAEREQLARDAKAIPAVPSAGKTLSVYPHATQRETVQWLALFALFVAIRISGTGPRRLQYLAAVMLINGSLLAIVGLNQFFGAPENTIYWTFPTLGQVFGPFINRNHFAFHVNLCLGLSAGLLIGRLATSATGHGEETRLADRPWRDLPRQLLQDSGAMWMLAGIALMVAAILLSLSRGGIVAMLFGLSLFALGLRRLNAVRTKSMFLAAPLVLAFLLVAWMGLEPLEDRLADFDDGRLSRDGRWQVWADSLALAGKFPVLGTGYASFPYVEPLTRTRSDTPEAFWDFAHNDYLQVLVEGGGVQFALLLLLLFSVGRAAIRRLRQSIDPLEQACVLGASAALAGAALHSLVDFSMHVPANALLATTIAALLFPVAKENETGRTDGVAVGGDSAPSRRDWLPRLAIAISALAIAGILWTQSRGWELAERYRLAALREQRDSETADAARVTALLAAASRHAPGDASLHLALAESLEALEADDGQRDQATMPFLEDGNQRLRQIVIARDLCPLDPAAHMKLARHANRFERADTLDTYLRRALRLRPFDPVQWYVAGLAHWEKGRIEQACEAWQESLKRSSRYLEPILDQVADRLEPQGILTNVLADDGAQICRAAEKLFPVGSTGPIVDEYQAAALAAFEQKQHLAAEEAFLWAELLANQRRWDAAIAAYRTAVRQAPQQLAWRLQLADALRAAGNFSAARSEVEGVLIQRPGYPPAKSLQQRIAREAAEAKLESFRAADE